MRSNQNQFQSVMRWAAIGVAVAFAKPSLSDATLQVDGGMLEIGGGVIEAGAFVLGAAAELRGAGAISAPATLAGRITPGTGDGPTVGILTFNDLLVFDGAVYVCHIDAHETLDRIVAVGKVTGRCTVEFVKQPDAVPLWQIIIDGGAGSDFSEVAAVDADDWRLDTTGAVSLLVTDLRGDSNTDGLPDWWETLYFGGRTAADAEGDADHDGFKNLHEFLAGTDPTDPKCLLYIIGTFPDKDNPSDIIVTWRSVPGKRYAVYGRPDFGLNSGWAELSGETAVHADGAFTEWRHAGAPLHYYYRVRLVE